MWHTLSLSASTFPCLICSFDDNFAHKAVNHSRMLAIDSRCYKNKTSANIAHCSDKIPRAFFMPNSFFIQVQDVRRCCFNASAQEEIIVTDGAHIRQMLLREEFFFHIQMEIESFARRISVFRASQWRGKPSLIEESRFPRFVLWKHRESRCRFPL